MTRAINYLITSYRRVQIQINESGCTPASNKAQGARSRLDPHGGNVTNDLICTERSGTSNLSCKSTKLFEIVRDLVIRIL